MSAKDCQWLYGKDKFGTIKMMKNDVVTTRKKNKRDGMMDLQNQITFGEQNRMQNCMSDIF